MGVKAMAGIRKRVEAVGYMRTSSAANVGADKDSEKRQRAAIEGYAKAAGYVIVDWFYDAAVIERDGGPALIARVKALRDQRPRLSLRDIAAELERDGHVTAKGNRHSAAAVRSMLRSG
jgi:Resolvase, N terminal domain